MRPLDAISFDCAGLTLQGEEANRRIWQTAAGDRVTVQFISGPPDVSTDLRDLDRMRAEERARMACSSGAIVEVELRTLAGRAVLYEIAKVPQAPSGMGYLGTIALPFSDFTYLVFVACRERGITGLRDTAVFAELCQLGEVTFAEGSEQPTGWMRDPYDDAIATPPGRNRSDDECHDLRFPDHPLSRVRGILRQIESTLRLADEFKGMPPLVK